MHALINRLPIMPDADWVALARKVDEFNALIDDPDFRGASLIRIGDDAALVLVLFASRAALDKLSREVAAPWFADNLRPYVAGAGERLVGEIVAGALHYRARELIARATPKVSPPEIRSQLLPVRPRQIPLSCL